MYYELISTVVILVINIGSNLTGYRCNYRIQKVDILVVVILFLLFYFLIIYQMGEKNPDFFLS
jgi:hypothetical protein